jgi:hypothetical protein
LKAEVDIQTGKAENSVLNGPAGDSKFKGYQGVLQATLPMDPLTVNATLAYGSGLEQLAGTSTSKDVNQIITVMDADQHYTLIYEYLEQTGALNTVNVGTGNESLHTGFANTMAAELGVMFALSKSLAIGADAWYLQAVEDVSINGAEPSNKLGTEIDFKLNWKLYDNLTWNWQAGWFMHGDAYKHADNSDADDSTAVLGMLSFKF